MIFTPTDPTRDWRTDPRPGDTVQEIQTGMMITIGGRVGDGLSLSIFGRDGNECGTHIAMSVANWASHYGESKLHQYIGYRARVNNQAKKSETN
jgi:hypothetical protein